MTAYFRNIDNANAEIARLREACSTINEGWLEDYERLNVLRRALEKIARETTDAQSRADALLALTLAGERAAVRQVNQ